MTSPTKIVLGCLGIAIAASLHSPVLAQAEPSKQTESTQAESLGGPLTPSNEALFQSAQQSERTIKLTDEEKAKSNKATPAPLVWESEHLNEQRRGATGFSFINVDLN